MQADIKETRPVSESFMTLVDSNGNNRIIIDTDSAPWDTTNRMEVAINTLMLLANKTLPVGPLTFDEMLAVAMDDVDIVEEAVSGDESVEELWHKVCVIEAAISQFVRLVSFSNKLKMKHDDLGAYLDLIAFVRRHTRGHLYKEATAIADLFSVWPIVDPSVRGWKCPICCEGGQNAHMCYAFPCNHAVHMSCMLNMYSAECPECRRLV